MRVSDSMIYLSSQRNINAQRSAMQEASNRVSSGVRVTHSWDDPAASSGIVQGTADASRLTSIAKINDRTYDDLAVMDTALSEVKNAVDRARELAVQLGNDTMGPQERAGGGSEVRGLIKEITAALNTKVGSRYIFAGDQTDAPPFNIAGVYSGDAGVRQIEIAPGVLQEASLRNDEVIKGTAGGQDVYQALDDLAVALENNDADGIRTALGTVSTSGEQVLAGRVRVGVMMTTFEAASVANTAISDASNRNVANLSQADLAQEASRLAQAGNALQATFAASSKSFNLSLLNFL